MPPNDGTALTIRAATSDDQDFLGAMLYEAAYWRPGSPRPPLEEALAIPELRISVEGWPRPGDRGAVASLGNERIGAAWYRLYTAEAPTYGFVDARTPAVSIAVAAPYRGQGVGQALLAALVAQARLDGTAALSLSVEDGNPARRLYERFGFDTVAREGNAHTMLARLG